MIKQNNYQFTFFTICILFGFLKVSNNVSGHTEDTNDEQGIVISQFQFIITILVIIALMTSIIYLIDNLQGQNKLISKSTLVIVGILIIILNSVIALNYYLEVN